MDTPPRGLGRKRRSRPGDRWAGVCSEKTTPWPGPGQRRVGANPPSLSRLLEGSQAVRPPAPWVGLRLPSHEGCCGSYALLFVPELPPGVAGCTGGRLSPTLPRARATRTETP